MNMKPNSIVKVLFDNKRLIFPLLYLVSIIGLAVCAGLFSVNPNKIDLNAILMSPCGGHIFGTDELGRDYFVRCMYGARISLFVGFFAMLVSLCIGTVLGVIAGYCGNLVDEILMRFIDFISAIPSMILITVVGMFIKKNVFSVILIIGMFSWVTVARLIRAEVLSLRQRAYVRYAQYLGEKNITIIIKHILPQVAPLIISTAIIGIAGSIMAESALSYLGLGVVPPTATWGALISHSMPHFQKAPHMAIIPGLFIFFTVHSCKEIGAVIKKYVSVETSDEITAK